MLDTYKYKGLRKALVAHLQERGISHQEILDAFLDVPRHGFVDSALADQAYEDVALPIPEQQTISQPYTVAFQTLLLQPKPRMKILEIGTGSGYQTAILCALGCRVFTVEYIAKLHRTAKARLEDLGYEPKMLCGDGSKGWPKYQPYEGILVTAAGPSVPLALQEQLEIGGRLVMPVGSEKSQHMVVVTRKSRSEYERETLQKFRFVPLRGKYGFEEPES
ncbi:MAG: protein-L-isoaspartate(D-aspartate) O-methyltransferase [Bacteroidota bacterium]